MIPCTYCGGDTELIRLNKLYKKLPRGANHKVWHCKTCGAYARWSPDGIDGDFADRPLRQMRIQLHFEFDKLWKSGSMTRDEAYSWLSKELGLPSRLSHIRYLKEDQCNNIMEALCRHFKK